MIRYFQREYYGFWILFADGLKEVYDFNEFAYLWLFFWSSVWIVIYSLLRKNVRFRSGIGITGMIILYGVIVVQLLFPIDVHWQLRLKIPGIMNPIREFLVRQLTLIGGNSITVWQMLLAVWAIGSVIQLCRLIRKRIEVRQLLSRLPSEQIKLQDSIAALLPKHTQVYRYSGITVPFGIGILKKRILIPNRSYSDTELENIIRHEAAHLRNMDPLIALLTDVICMLHWWNPCVYLLQRDLERSMELRCDKQAVQGMDREQVACYMETLLAVFRDRYIPNRRVGLGLLGSGNRMREEMRERFEALYAGANASSKSRAVVGSVLAAAVALVLMIFSYSVVCVPYYKITEADLDIPADAYYVVSAEAYIIEHEDGSGTLCTSQGEVEIPKEEVEFLEKDGVPVVNGD